MVKRELREDLTEPYNSLGFGLLYQVTSDRRRRIGLKLCQEWFRLETKKNFFAAREVRD